MLALKACVLSLWQERESLKAFSCITGSYTGAPFGHYCKTHNSQNTACWSRQCHFTSCFGLLLHTKLCVSLSLLYLPHHWFHHFCLCDLSFASSDIILSFIFTWTLFFIASTDTLIFFGFRFCCLDYMRCLDKQGPDEKGSTLIRYSFTHNLNKIMNIDWVL